MEHLISTLRLLGRALTTVKGWAVLFLCFDCAFWALLLLRPLGHAELVAADDVLQCIGPLLAVLLCLVPLRRRWLGTSLFLGLGILAYVGGQGIWSFNQLIAHQTPFPSSADLVFLASAPLLLLGVLLLSTRPLPRISRVRVGLDGVMMMTAIITFSWYFVLGPTLLQGSTSLLAKVVGTAYPCSDLVLLLCVLLLWARQQDRALRPVLLLLSLGMLTLVLTDSVYDYQNLQNSFAIGGLIDPLWSLSFQVIGLGALALRRAPKLSPAVSPQPSRSLWQILLPYAIIPALSPLLLYVWLTPGNNTFETGVYVGAALLIGLVLLRQIVAMRELHTLYINNDALASANRQLEVQATHDALTGLPNRSLLWTRIQPVSPSARRDHHWATLLILDLDRFKEVNDTFGHQLGDQLLRQVGERLCQSVDPAVTVSRIGGDEFAVFLPETDETTALQVVAQLNTALEEPFLIGEYPLQIEASTGIALYPAHGNDPVTLCQHADVAMYLAKQSPERYAFYDARYDHYSQHRLALLGDLRKAIGNSELRLYYQPKAELQTGLVKGVEALVRWQHPTEGFIAPDQFIPLAEQTGLITPLTRWVVETAIRQCREWLDAGLELRVAVNLSMRNLRDASLPDTIADLLAQYRVPPRLFCCEITESAVMADLEHTLHVLNCLVALEVPIAIDDYGTGYASLSYLKRLPASELKIDRTFVQHLTTDQADQAIVRSTVSMAHNLGFQVVAEGVEDQATWNLLASFKCDIAQGYYLSRPIPPQDLVRWLDARQEGGAHGLEDRKEAVAL